MSKRKKEPKCISYSRTETNREYIPHTSYSVVCRIEKKRLQNVLGSCTHSQNLILQRSCDVVKGKKGPKYSWKRVPLEKEGRSTRVRLGIAN